ncbi:glycosyltransferase [Acidisoma silvae]|uniref:Glycosyltransferase family 4 protein n=1 Tax=Acidisoma silvae TaxID=2802396 RepID=A0A963YR80_9PROT|nr:glycosyltransferase family 4 protein [Acidisoma silvae]MCB8875651.1 glycosyltransferase family 4 protein [Acidisoma silvae]
MTKRTYDIVVFFPGSILPEMDGAHARVVDLMDRLADEPKSVALYSFSGGQQHSWTPERRSLFAARWPNIDLITESRPKSVKYLSYAKKLLLGLFPFKAKKILSLKIGGATPEWQALQQSTSTFIINYQKGLCEVNGVDPSRCLIETHDLHFLKGARVHGTSPFALTSLLKLRAEFGAYAAVQGLFAISPAETTVFKMMLPEVPTYFISSWTLPSQAAPVPQVGGTEFDFIFVGSAYQMNGRGLCALYEAEGHWLSRYHVAVCGQVCEDADVIALASRHNTISLLGYVDDLGATLKRARLALSPVSGTGAKMKILSAIRAGLPVLASPSSMEGLAPGYEAAVLPIEESICRRLLTDAAAYDAAQTAALRYARAHSLAGEAAAAMTAMTRPIRRLAA